MREASLFPAKLVFKFAVMCGCLLCMCVCVWMCAKEESASLSSLSIANAEESRASLLSALVSAGGSRRGL